MSDPNLVDHHAENQRLRAQIADIQTQLMQAQKMGSVGALATSITHEFNNILTTVINYAKMGLRHQDPETREKAFNKILSAGQRGAKITTGMLSYARGHAEQREPHNLVQLVRDVLVLVEKDLHVHRINLTTEFEGEPHASVNTSQIQQVLINLVVNARQAMRPGGTLTVCVSENHEQGCVEIAIKDTGSGIPPEKLPKIFDNFYSTKRPDEDGRGGTGVGLALCKDIVEAHRGRIRVESAVGYGTTFTLKFPIAQPAGIVPHRPRAAVPTA